MTNNKKILLINPPFSTVVSPPYSITYLNQFLINNLDSTKFEINVLDLNIFFHNLEYKNEKEFYQNFSNNFDLKQYNNISKEFRDKTKNDYAKNNLLIVNNKNPKHIDKLIEKIKSFKPDIIGISIVYSSQAFYAQKIVDNLKNENIKIIIGGPSVNEKLKSKATYLANEIEFLNEILNKKLDIEKINFNTILDYSIFNDLDYFTPKMIYPVKTSNTCYYQKCSFCNHHNNQTYFEYSLDNIEETIKKLKHKNVFFIDDMIHKKRLLEIAKITKKYNVKWFCQLKPTNDFDLETLKILKDSGLLMIIWGVESGCDRILKLMQKGTNKADIQNVLLNSKKVGIFNVVYLMFGFPTETKEEFKKTINFAILNKNNIDLISTSTFGLQKNTVIFNNPKKFGIKKINEEKRTILEPKISFECFVGLTRDELKKLKKIHFKKLEKINKFPKMMNYFREHMFILAINKQ
ncbi:MAG: B12-binding domain-containing radical SAM protein [Candidatus Woesearchaeota archaeon]